MPPDDDYVCGLTEASVKKAKEELHEEPYKERDNAVKQFREWVLDQKSWLSSPTDATFLLSFLRVRKFSQLLARESLANYWHARKVHPEYFNDVDITSSKMMAVLKSGLMLVLPKPDPEGRRIIIIRPRCVDISGKEYSKTDVFKLAFALHQFLIMDENVQVNGLCYLLDHTRVENAHEDFVGNEKKKFTSLLSKSFPVRIKQFNLYNTGIFLEIIMLIIKTAASEKLGKRIKTHGVSMVSVYEAIDKSVLPLEYLPDDHSGPHGGPVQNIIDQQVKDMTQPHVVQWLKSLSSGEFWEDEKKRPTKMGEEEATFRFRRSSAS